MRDKFKEEMLVPRIYESGSGAGLHHVTLEITEFDNDSVTFTYKFE